MPGYNQNEYISYIHHDYFNYAYKTLIIIYIYYNVNVSLLQTIKFRCLEFQGWQRSR